MTNLLLERLLRGACFTFLAVMLVLVLAACGPGGGGTGTGPTASYSNRTTPTTGAGSPGGGLDGGSVGGVSGDGGMAPPAGGVAGVACGPVDLRFGDGRVELVTGCGSFVFAGDWAADVDQQVVLPGTLRTAAGTAIPATLRMQFSGPPETSLSVTVTVTDEAGHALVGPEVLARTASPGP
jgi:hypothetical protein